jgi:hypothetical protein
MDHYRPRIGNLRRVGWVVSLLATGCGSQSTTAPTPPHQPPAYAMSYGELQKDWEAHLMRTAGGTSPAS